MVIESDLRDLDLVKVVDVTVSTSIKARVSVLKSKTRKPVCLDISNGTRASFNKWIEDELIIRSNCL